MVFHTQFLQGFGVLGRQGDAADLDSEDAKKLVNQEKSFACAEIQSARSVVLRIGEALEEQEKASQASKPQDVDGLIEEVQEARRIKLLHQPSKVMVMEYELRALHQLPLHHHLPLVPPLALGGSISRGLGVYL
ncbi:stomatal closure-related actin-binding protein 3 isoform X2 [Cajanus cajan]|uniref:stomatal closure-related actin-binding protein 3 isoform X2 n=1 Tax=Cajanus cajan TaxID=3821 RepID=UPI00098D9E1A|nr:stomatal closure-related actin-binding protein 3 isoform X2 [Cajanus cajan]